MHFNGLKLSGALDEFSITSAVFGFKNAKLNFLKKISVYFEKFMELKDM